MFKWLQAKGTDTNCILQSDVMFTPSGCQVIEIIKLEDASSNNFLQETQSAEIKFWNKIPQENFREASFGFILFPLFLNKLIQPLFCNIFQAFYPVSRLRELSHLSRKQLKRFDDIYQNFLIVLNIIQFLFTRFVIKNSCIICLSCFLCELFTPSERTT